MGILKDHLILTLILSGLFIRLSLALLPGFKLDVDTWFAWAARINDVGFSNFYSSYIWTNYTPGYLYVLKLLDLMKNLFGLGNQTFYLILKLPAIFSELALGFLIYKLSLKNSSIKTATIAASLVILNPALIFNSAIWGQIDSVLTLFLFICIYSLYSSQLIISSIFFAISFLIKPQAIAILPVFGLFIINNISLRIILKIILPFFITMIFLSLPFFGNNLAGLGQLFLQMSGDYPYTSLYAYNFWGFVGFWIQDNAKWGILSFQEWGYLSYGVYWIVMIYFYLTKKISIFALTVLALLSFYFLPTRVHERYLYPAIPFLVLLAVKMKSKIILTGVSFLSIFHLINLYFVYVYYNEIYQNLPKILYQPQLYELIENNAKALSLISTLIFLGLSYIILKSKHAKENI